MRAMVPYNIDDLVLDVIEYVRLVILFLVNNIFKLFNLFLLSFKTFLHLIGNLFALDHSKTTLRKSSLTFVELD